MNSDLLNGPPNHSSWRSWETVSISHVHTTVHTHAEREKQQNCNLSWQEKEKLYWCSLDPCMVPLHKSFFPLCGVCKRKPCAGRRLRVQKQQEELTEWWLFSFTLFIPQSKLLLIFPLFFPQINRKVEENINEKMSFTSLQTVKQELEVDCNFLYLVSNPYSHVYGPRYVNQAVVPSINRFGGLKKRNQKEFRTHKQHGIFDVIFLPFRMWHSWMFVRLFLEVYSPTAASLSYSSQP